MRTLTLLVFMLCGSIAFSEERAPIDYFTNALQKQGIQATDVRVLSSPNPVYPASQAFTYLKETTEGWGLNYNYLKETAEGWGLNPKAPWSLYRVIVVVDGKIQDCVGAISSGPEPKKISIDNCDAGTAQPLKIITSANF